MQFTVDRRTWLRGEGSRESLLLRPSDGKMCCLGFMCLAMGCQPADITDVSVPEHAVSRPEPLREVLVKNRELTNNGVTSPMSLAMHANDSQIVTDAHRERVIHNALQPLGLEVEFVN